MLGRLQPRWSAGGTFGTLGFPLSRNILSRSRESNPLPEGTLAVGVGLLVVGVSAWGFLVVSARALGKAEYAPLSVLWSLVFLAGPGFFLPLEQEVSRALAGRRARGLGSGPLLRRAALLGGGLAAMLVVIAVIASPALIDHLFRGRVVLFVAFLAGLLGYYAEHLARGAFSGLGRFKAYSTLITVEGTSRLLAAVVLALVGIEKAGPFGLALGLAPWLGVAVALRGQRDLVQPGPEATYSELSSALGALLVGSVFAQALLFIGVIAVDLLATDAQQDEASRFLTGLIIARIPLFLFQAVQAALLPRLSALAEAGRFDDFRAGFRRLLVVVVGIGVIGTAGSLAIGPWVVRLLFGAEFDLGNRTMGILAASSALFMLAIAMAQAVIALGGHARMAASWAVGVATFVVVTALGHDLFLRVELGLLAGCGTAAVCMALVLMRRIRSGAAVAVDDLIEAIHDLPGDV